MEKKKNWGRGRELGKVCVGIVFGGDFFGGKFVFWGEREG
jgi:hypothetical protein